MTLAKYGWWLDQCPQNRVGFSSGAANNAVNLNSFYVLSGAAASPGQISDFTIAAWFYFDNFANLQSIGFESDVGANGGGGNPYFGIQLTSDPQVVGCAWGDSGISGVVNRLIPYWSGRTIAAGSDWVCVIMSVHITDTTAPGTATVSMAYLQYSLGRAGDQSITMLMPTGDPSETINLDQLPNFSAANPSWVLDNDEGSNTSVGGVDWVTFVPTYYDLTVQANRELFSTDDGTNVYPKDTSPLNPLVLFRGDHSAFPVNRADSTTWTESGGGGPLADYPAPLIFGP